MFKNFIRVYCRLKPNFDYDSQPCFEYQICSDICEDDNEIFVVRGRHCNAFVNNKPDTYRFRFHKVFDEDTEQEELYEVVAKQVVEGVIDGYNGTIFAYGQTGSGKTYTISGVGVTDTTEEAIVHRSMTHIFQELEEKPSDDYRVDISFMEIYNEIGYDLLNNGSDRRIILQEDEDGEIQLRNLSRHNIQNYNEFIELYKNGENNRTESNTLLNQYSSRSHCILTVYVTVRIPDSKGFRKSKLHLVDLAGSERISKTGINSHTVVEARHINLSLHYLEQVIVALGEKHRMHIPYRNSMMTTVLRDSLGGNCFTAMVATLATNSNNLEETLSTCRFAQRVALVRNEARLNTFGESMELDVLKAELSALKAQMSETSFKGVIVNFKKKMDQHLSEDEALECQNFVDNFINKHNINCHHSLPKVMVPIIKNPHKIRVCFEIFKSVILDTQKKRRKAEKQAHSIYQRVLESKKDTEFSQKNSTHSNSEYTLVSNSKSSSLRPQSNKTISQSCFKYGNKQKSKSSVRQSMSKEDELESHQSTIHTNCVTHEVFKETMDNLVSVIEECKEAHLKELSKLDSIQKLMEENVLNKLSHSTDFIGKLNQDKISELKLTEKEDNHIDISNNHVISNEDTNEEIVFTFDASKKYSEKYSKEDYLSDKYEVRDYNKWSSSGFECDSICGNLTELPTKEQAAIENDSQLISFGINSRENIEDYFENKLPIACEPDIKFDEVSSSPNNKNRIVKENIIGKRQLQGKKDFHVKFEGKQSALLVPRKLSERMSESKCNWSKDNKKTGLGSFDVPLCYEGNSVNYKLSDITSSQNDCQLTEVKKNAIRNFEEKYHERRRYTLSASHKHCCITKNVNNCGDSSKKQNYYRTNNSIHPVTVNNVLNKRNAENIDNNCNEKIDNNCFKYKDSDRYKNCTISGYKNDKILGSFEQITKTDQFQTDFTKTASIENSSVDPNDCFFHIVEPCTKINSIVDDDYDYVPKRLQSCTDITIKNFDGREKDIDYEITEELLNKDLVSTNLTSNNVSDNELDDELIFSSNLEPVYDFEDKVQLLKSPQHDVPLESDIFQLLPLDLQNYVKSTELGFRNVSETRKTLKDIIPFTGETDIDDEIMAFYQRQISNQT